MSFISFLSVCIVTIRSQMTAFSKWLLMRQLQMITHWLSKQSNTMHLSTCTSINSMMHKNTDPSQQMVYGIFKFFIRNKGVWLTSSTFSLQCMQRLTIEYHVGTLIITQVKQRADFHATCHISKEGCEKLYW